MKKLDQKVAIVTGAAQGIGRAIADELARAGAHVAVFDLNIESAQIAAAEISKLGVTSRGYAVDVSQSKVVDDAFAQVVADFGRLDILVNNAGVLLHARCNKIFSSSEIWKRGQYFIYPRLFFQPRKNRILCN